MHLTLDEALDAAQEWGCNCGPAALAASLGVSLRSVRRLFENWPGFTNPGMMGRALLKWGGCFSRQPVDEQRWPEGRCLVRIQWHGPWMQPGVPVGARYRQTHWVATRWHRIRGPLAVFDINGLHWGNGGWWSLGFWEHTIVPAILANVPRADGGWSRTHVYRLD